MLFTAAEALHNAVVTGFRQLGAEQPEAIRQNVLLQEDCFAGYRYFCGRLQAEWWSGAGEVVFFDAAGKRLRAVGLATLEPMRHAA